MFNYIYLFVLYKYSCIYITHGSLHFRLDSRLGIMAYTVETSKNRASAGGMLVCTGSRHRQVMLLHKLRSNCTNNFTINILTCLLHLIKNMECFKPSSFVSRYNAGSSFSDVEDYSTLLDTMQIWKIIS